MRTIALAFLACSILALAAPSDAQRKKPAASKTKKTLVRPKPAANPATKAAEPKAPIVLGTTQLPGDFGKLGQTYTIGKYQPINFTLKSAEYSIEPFVTGTNINVPKSRSEAADTALHDPQPDSVRAGI